MSGVDSFEKQWQRWFADDDKPKRPTKRISSNAVLYILAGLLGIFILVSVLRGFFTEWLWFSELGYSAVYSKILSTRVLAFLVSASLFGVVFLGNVVLATRLMPKKESPLWPWSLVNRLRSVIRVNVILGTIFLCLIFGLVGQGSWETILRYFSGQPFGVTDPIFSREISFYVFTLPFLHLVQGWLIGAFIVSLIGVAVVYLVSYGVQRLRFAFERPVVTHIGVLLILILGLFGWGYWLGIWELVFSTQGVVFGASYTDMHANLPAQWILVVAVLAIIGIVIFSLIRR